jgi:phage gpG-like protein
MSLIRINDGISPDLRRRAAAVADKRPLLAAMGQSIKAISIQAFTDPAKRAQYWAPRKDTKPHALLQKSTTLRKSIRVIGITNDTVTIGSDRKYAATHQLGRGGIPARPFLPFYPSGQITVLGKVAVERALTASLRTRGL